MLRKLNLEEGEILNFTDQVRERKMGELFENFRGYDVPAVRRESQAKGEIIRLIKRTVDIQYDILSYLSEYPSYFEEKAIKLIFG